MVLSIHRPPPTNSFESYCTAFVIRCNFLTLSDCTISTLFDQVTNVYLAFFSGSHHGVLFCVHHGLLMNSICFKCWCQVVSYDFKKERFAHLHRLAIGFPEERFFYTGTPAAPGAKEAAEKGEAFVRAQFQEDPYGCLGSLHRKRLKRDPFHRFIPYPNGCPELKSLFDYCGPVPYPGTLPWIL